MPLFYEYAELYFSEAGKHSFSVSAHLWSVDGSSSLKYRDSGPLRDHEANAPWQMANVGLEAKRSYFLTNRLADTGWEPCGEGLWLKRQVVDPRPDIAIISEVAVMKKFPKLFADGERMVQKVVYHLTPTGRVELYRSEWAAYENGEQLTEQLVHQLKGDGWNPGGPQGRCCLVHRPLKE